MIRISVVREATRYRQLLTRDWDDTFPDRVLAWLWKSIDAKSRNGDAILLILNPRANWSDEAASVVRTVRERIAMGARFLRLPGMPRRASDGEIAEPTPSEWTALRLACYLTLQANADVTGDVDSFVDGQALAFQAVIHVVLPKLPTDGRLHEMTLDAAALFANGLFPTDPAHGSYLTSQLYGYLGDVDRRLRALADAFRYTERDDHSYLTKAQEYWMELLDAERTEDAREFVTQLARNCRPEQLPEVSEMMSVAFTHGARA